MINLINFQRPQRYVGNEYNVVKKAHGSRIPICLCYPDLYEIGMSNLGLRIIYSMFNEFQDIVCERAFLPGQDLARHLKNYSQKLFSLETKTSLDKFQVLGFNFDYELNFINFLNMLALARIPFHSGERKEIIVLGGAVANPEPLADFVDVFFIGEFEEGIEEFVAILKKYPAKNDRLLALSQVEGFYVPQCYENVSSHGLSRLEKKYPYASAIIKRKFVRDLDESYYPLKWLTPHSSIIHDRACLEIARGCSNKCKFCQARALYYPYRQKQPQTIIAQGVQIYKNSGYENFSLLSLSTSDYSSINELVDMFIEEFKDKSVGLSLPSLRVDELLGPLYQKLFFLKKTSLTVAVEAASPELRAKLNKNIDTDKLFEAAKILRSLKKKHLKVYFMYGFLEETDEDLTAIGQFLLDLSRDAKINLNASINIFIPKPFSLWQGMAMESEDSLSRKQKVIIDSLKFIRSINVSFSQVKKSILEAILSRADRKFSKVIEKAFLRGISSDHDDSWKGWQEAMEQENIDYRQYLYSSNASLPWSFISSCTAAVEQQNDG